MNVVGHIPDSFIGPGAVKKLGKLSKGYGAEQAFVITDPGLTAAGLTEKVGEILKASGISVTVYDEVMANPTVSVVEEGAWRLRRLLAKGRTVVVTLGGGSSMDAGKTIAMLAGQPQLHAPGVSVLDFMCIPGLAKDGTTIDRATIRPRKVPVTSGIPTIIAIPTTSGTASETNGAAVITDTSGGSHRKLVYDHDSSKASAILLDPELTVGVPQYPTATCGMDVLTHALEAFTAKNASEYGEAVAFGAIKLVASNLPQLVGNLSDIERRRRIQLASHMAGVAFNVNGLGIVHAMGHPLSAMYNQAHGQTLATMLPTLMRFNMDGSEECTRKYAEVAKAFGAHDPSRSTRANAEAAVRAVANLSQRVGTAKTIVDLGGKREDIPALVDQALRDVCILRTIRMPSREEATALYLAAFWPDAVNPSMGPSKL